MRLVNLAFLLPFAGACAGAAPVPASHPAVKNTVLFLCPYGGAKSVIAASYFNRIAHEHDLPYVAVAAAAEEPYDAVPPVVARFLEGEGFDVHAFKPRHVDTEELRSATRVVSIDCNLEGLDLAGVTVARWDDVPKVSDGVDAAAASIRRHVQTLAEELARGESPR